MFLFTITLLTYFFYDKTSFHCHFYHFDPGQLGHFLQTAWIGINENHFFKEFDKIDHCIRFHYAGKHRKIAKPVRANLPWLLLLSNNTEINKLKSLHKATICSIKCF
ncbi:hypothetical protein Y032_0061g3209 [Ancylostoma ceylanicum]|uniref:Uncharacterized protein n=1 Tax=Ancylostoma ceylanicum TaxID=53326 RepID=A0A016U3L9_9BILA|nr:hypothetical protein Y032_0061g3209 [Ancylostoma ceylanicum]